MLFRQYYLSCHAFNSCCASQEIADGEESESPVESPEAPPSFSRVMYISGDRQEVTGIFLMPLGINQTFTAASLVYYKLRIFSLFSF